MNDSNSTKDIIRKPILTTSCRRNAENHPEFLDTEALLERFEPLLRSIHKKFCSYDGIFDQPDDTSDLYSQIQYEFLRLRQSYDPKRGVDFPGYIKFHLQQRVYHYVTKQQKLVNSEQPVKIYGSDDFDEKSMELENMPELVDEDTEIAFEKAEAIASIPWEDIEDPAQVELIKEILFNGKTVEGIAKERKVSIKSIKEQLDAVCDLLVELHQLNTRRDD